MRPLLSKIPIVLLTLIVGVIASSTAFGTSTIVIQNNDSAGVGFNDPTAATPVGGNSGTTVGQQRLNAFQFAADIWGATLVSGPTITIQASWAPFTSSCTASTGTLGSAGAASIFRDFPGATFSNTWYSVALANALAGSDLNGAAAEINARFNSNVGTTGCLETLHWYYGLDNNHGTNGVDLVTVLLHEFGHGLGFQTFTKTNTGVQAGTPPNLFPSIYDRFLFDNSTSKTWDQMTDVERVASAINTNNLAWRGSQVDSDAATVLTGGKDSSGRPLMFAPSPIKPGSSVSHWDSIATPNQLMEPNISGNLSHSVTTPQDLTFSLLRDIGWCSGCPQPPPPPPPTPTPPAAANDNFVNAQTISGCTGSVTGHNFAATHEAGEPSHSPDLDPGGGSVWYQWQAPSSGSVTMTTAGSDYDTLLAVYTGTSVNGLTAIVKNDDVDPGNITTSTVTFTATAGTPYKIAVDGWDDARGNIVLNWTENCSQSKTDQTITFGALSNKTFGDAPFTVSASASSGLPVSFSILFGPATISGNTITITAAGTVAVRASQSGDANFNAAPNVDQSFTVAKANQTITFNVLPSKSYGDGPFNVSATSSSNLVVSFNIVSGPAIVLGSTITITGVGTVTVRASQSGDANFNVAPNVDRSFTVAKGNQTISFNPIPPKIYGDALFNVSATASSGLPVSFSIVSGPATISGATITLTGAGTVTVRASQAGNSNYNAATPNDQSFTVSKANQTISFGLLPSKTFGDAPFPLSATSSSGLPVSFEILSGPATISGNTVSINGTGTVTVRATQVGNSNYNAASFVDQPFNVVSAVANISLTNLAHTYDGTAKFATATTNPQNLNVTFSYSQNGSPVTSPVNAGAYNVTATINNPDFQGTTTGTLVINKATPVITWNNPANIPFGTALSSVQLNATTNVPGSFLYNALAGTVLSVGTYQLSTTFIPSDVANYYTAAASVQLTVDPTPLTLLTEDGTNNAVALDSVTRLRGPFPIVSDHNFSLDHRTRVVFFTTNFGLGPGDTISVQVQDASLQTYTLPIEQIVFSSPEVNQAAYIVVKLTDALPAGDVDLSVTLRGATSNKAKIVIVK